MAVTGNPYGFYPDRTKYPLANLDGQLVPAPHHHTLDDIDDYEEEPPEIPEEDSAWENKKVNGITSDPNVISLKAIDAIPVEAGITYIFDLNTSFQGKIFFNTEDQYPDGYPTIYPYFWTAPSSGFVRFQIKREDGTAILPSEVNLVGLEFKPSTMTDILKKLEDLTFEEDIIFGSNTVDSYTDDQSQLHETTYGTWLQCHRYGRTLMFELLCVTGRYDVNDVADSTWDHLRILPYSSFYRIKENPSHNPWDPEHLAEPWPESDFETDGHGAKIPFPARLLPAFGIGDWVGNSDSMPMHERRLWLNWNGPGLYVWSQSATQPDVVRCVFSGCFVCKGKD